MSEMRDLFLIRNIRAARVNLMMNDYAAGLPSPLAFLGLGDLLARRLGLTPWSARALPILHRVVPSDGRTKPEMENKSGAFQPIETMEDLTGYVELSLLLHLPGCPGETALRSAFGGVRIAGGLIQNGEVDIREVTPDGSALQGVRRGYVMTVPDRPDRRFITSGDRGPEQPGLSRIADLLFPAERGEGFGLVVPAAVGYRLLEDPASAPKRIRTRSKDVPHVYAEPVIGIAELVSARNPRLTALDGPGLSAQMWGWETHGDLILGHSGYIDGAAPNPFPQKITNSDQETLLDG
jgi:hypothetical protein